MTNTDPVITVASELKTKWALTGALTATNIRFSTGWYDQEFNAGSAAQITVTHLSELDIPFELGYGVVRTRMTLQIDVWVPVLRATNKGRGQSKDYVWKCREEVNRILKAAHPSIGSIKLLLLNRTGLNLDELDAKPPILRWSKQIQADVEF